MTPKDQLQLFGIYARETETQDWVRLESVRCKNIDDARNMVADMMLDHKEASDGIYDAYGLRPVNKVKNAKNAQSPLEVDRSKRLRIFKDEIISGYQDGLSLQKLKEIYGVSIPKIKNFLLKNSAKQPSDQN